MVKTKDPIPEHSYRQTRVRVAIEIRRWVEEGLFAAGQVLPTEQSLCDRLQVSRGTIRGALQQLETEGLLVGQMGEGRMRGRIVSPRMTPRNSLMLKTTVLLTHLSTDPTPQMAGGLLEATDSGAVDRIQAEGMHVFVLHPDALNEADMARLLADPPAGIVVGPGVADYMANREVLLKLQGKIPMVVGSDEDMWSNCDRVISDHAAGAYALTRFLVEQGCKKILRVWGNLTSEHYWLKMRNRGHEQAMSEVGLPAMAPVMLKGILNPPNPQVPSEVFEMRTRQVTAFLIEHLNAKKKIDAIMATSDTEAFYIAAACRLFGVVPGRDIQIVGYDNHFCEAPQRAFESAQPLATVDKMNHALGEEMVRLLLARIAGTLPPKPQRVVLAPRMVISPELALPTFSQ